MAHGYAKVARKPMAAMVHGTVGLQHAAMAIYNAYADRAPIVVLSGNILDGATLARRRMEPRRSRSGVAGARFHQMGRPARLVAGFRRVARAKLRSGDHGADGAGADHRRCRSAGRRDRLPRSRSAFHSKMGVRTQPQGDSGAVREAAKMLVAAENPVIYANRYGRTENAPALLVELAEVLNAPVVDAHARMNFPSRHKYNHSARREASLPRKPTCFWRSSRLISGASAIGFWLPTTVRRADGGAAGQSQDRPHRHRACWKGELRGKPALRRRGHDDQRAMPGNHAKPDRAVKSRSPRRGRAELATHAARSSAR